MKNLFLLIPLLVLLSCSKPSEPKPAVTIDIPEMTMYYDGSHQFVLNQGSVRVQATDYTWSVSDPYSGTISTSGLFTAKHIGENVITGTSKKNLADVVKAKVTVKPYFTTWGPIVTNWGFNKASVKFAESRTLLSEDATSLGYYGENDKVRGVVYVFEADALIGAVVLPQNSSALAKETATFLIERYDVVDYKNGIYAFTDHKQIAVGLTVNDKSGVNVLYIPYKKGGRIGNSLDAPAHSILQRESVASKTIEEIRSQFKTTFGR